MGEMLFFIAVLAVTGFIVILDDGQGERKK
jgi:hypothetical protein